MHILTQCPPVRAPDDPVVRIPKEPRTFALVSLLDGHQRPMEEEEMLAHLDEHRFVILAKFVTRDGQWPLMPENRARLPLLVLNFDWNSQ